MTEFLVATHNARKLEELSTILAGYGHTVRGFAGDLPVEGAADLVVNATAKVQAVHAVAPEAWLLADDSGLFLDALPQRLGVRTHRELPAEGTNAALLGLLKAGMARTCTLRSTIVLLSPSGALQVATGELRASLAKNVRGELSRGFDRLLIPAGEALTLAQMSLAQRLPYLPRQRALAQLLL